MNSNQSIINAISHNCFCIIHIQLIQSNTKRKDGTHTKLIQAISTKFLHAIPAATLMPWHTAPLLQKLGKWMRYTENQETCLETSLWQWSHPLHHHYPKGTNHHPQTH